MIAVTSGQKTLKDATNEAMRDWMGSVDHTHYIIGTRGRAASVSDDRAGFSDRASAAKRGEQCLEIEGRLPDYVVACVGGGSNAAGIFAPFVDDVRSS